MIDTIKLKFFTFFICFRIELILYFVSQGMLETQKPLKKADTSHTAQCKQRYNWNNIYDFIYFFPLIKVFSGNNW